jgi:hypothetical protein
VKTAAQWKQFYAEERAALGPKGLDERLDGAPEVDLPTGGALVFPHTRLAVSGDLTAAVARAVVRSGAADVLALGVLHNGVQAESASVARARSGDAGPRGRLRRVYEARDPFCVEEFSLDNFEALLELAAGREGKAAPRVHARFPFLVGDDPVDLPGLAELEALAAQMPVVATTDPVHHGAGYGTPEGQRLPLSDEASVAWTRGCIQQQLDLLSRGDWAAFARLAAQVRSDFRDVGPVLAHLLPGARGEILELYLVDYAEVLGAEEPTWVAAPLMRVMLPA